METLSNHSKKNNRTKTKNNAPSYLGQNCFKIYYTA